MKKKHQGAVTVETALAIPIFLIAMVQLFLCMQDMLATTTVFEGSLQALYVTAQNLHKKQEVLPFRHALFENSLDDEERIQKHIQNGNKGIHFICSMNQDLDVCLQVRYKTKYGANISYALKQRAFVGDDVESLTKESEMDDAYVYITNNKEAYHSRRSCTHLQLSVSQSTIEYAKKQGLRPCEYCGEDAGQSVYITNDGDCFHSRSNCTGLKRTVQRVRKKDVAGIPACLRCGGN
ncbi:MAG: hypothetical protein ACI4EK_02960 [Wujia sp.]